MAFAIFFEPEDAAAIAGSINAGTLPTAMKNEARKYWMGGLSGWATAPVGAPPGDTSCPLCRILVISGSGLTLAAFIALCKQIGAFIGSGTVAGHYLEKLAVEMAQTGIEPWPIV
jgi:hypothetical protein